MKLSAQLRHRLFSLFLPWCSYVVGNKTISIFLHNSQLTGHSLQASALVGQSACWNLPEPGKHFDCQCFYVAERTWRSVIVVRLYRHLSSLFLLDIFSGIPGPGNPVPVSFPGKQEVTKVEIIQIRLTCLIRLVCGEQQARTVDVVAFNIFSVMFRCCIVTVLLATGVRWAAWAEKSDSNASIW